MRQFRCGAPQQLRHHQALTQLPKHERQLQCGVPQELHPHQVRTQLPRRSVVETADNNIERSWYGSKRKWQKRVVSGIASSIPADSYPTASRLEMYSTTEYCEGRVVCLRKESPAAGCRIDFVLGRTADDSSNRGSNRQVDQGGSVVDAPMVVPALGSSVRVRRNFFASNNLEGTLSCKS